jgi:hypothetical protein
LTEAAIPVTVPDAGAESVSIALFDANGRIEILRPSVLVLLAYAVGIDILIVFAGVCPPFSLPVPVVVKTNEYFIVLF